LAQTSDGSAVLASARESVPELVLLDVTIPGLDCYEVTRRLRGDEATAGIPIVHTSTSPSPWPTRKDSFDAGADAYLVLPCEAADVVEIIRPLIRLRLAELAASKRADALRISNEKKDEFIVTLGHELRNPLNAVRAGLSLLETCGADADRATRIRATVARQTESLVRLVDDLLDVARIAQGKFSLEIRPVDLCEVVARSVELARSSFEQLGVSVSFDTGTAHAFINGDAGRLGQIVANLLDNALKYTPAGGRVEVTVSVVDGVREARLRFKDSGVGIDKNHLEKGLFQLFAQGDTSLARREGGLGIGLSVVHRIVEIHGGSTTVSSAGPGLGTEVVIDFPLLPLSAAMMTAAGVGADDHPMAAVRLTVSRRVLLVDDHADSCELFQEVLRLEGHAVTVANNGQLAVALLLADGFDVAVVDIGLPDIDGCDVARLTRERLGGASPLFVAMTGYAGTREREAATRAGFDLYLVKPVDTATLIEIVAASPANAAR
jgi:two-component system, sensor histidine kinase